MALDRWIALAILALCLVYGYTAFFTMDALLPPFMQRNPVWPSSFPKILAVAGACCALLVLISPSSQPKTKAEIDYRRLGDYQWLSAVLLLSLMVAYALLLRPFGFLLSTTLFLFLGAYILGERRYFLQAIVSLSATLLVWYLVQQVLGIFLRPLPFFQHLYVPSFLMFL